MGPIDVPGHGIDVSVIGTEDRPGRRVAAIAQGKPSHLRPCAKIDERDGAVRSGHRHGGAVMADRQIKGAGPAALHVLSVLEVAPLLHSRRSRRQGRSHQLRRAEVNLVQVGRAAVVTDQVAKGAGGIDDDGTHSCVVEGHIRSSQCRQINGVDQIEILTGHQRQRTIRADRHSA